MNSLRANRVSTHVIFACPCKGCGHLVRQVNASRIKNKRVLHDTPASYRGEGEKARKARAKKAAELVPLRPGDGCGYCTGDKHKTSRHNTQLGLVEGAKWGRFLLFDRIPRWARSIDNDTTKHPQAHRHCDESRG